MPTIRERLEELRAELRAERMSYGELAELQSLAEHIEPGDVELLEAAGVPEAMLDEYGDSEFVVRISTRESVGIPTVDEIKKALYRGIDIIDSEDAVDVQRA